MDISPKSARKMLTINTGKTADNHTELPNALSRPTTPRSMSPMSRSLRKLRRTTSKMLQQQLQLAIKASGFLAAHVATLPLSINGVALAIVGLGSLWSDASSESPWRFLEAFLDGSQVPFCIISALLLLFNLIRALVSWDIVVEELSDPKTFYVAGATVMATNLLFATFESKGADWAEWGIYTCAVVQVLVTTRFLYLCARDGLVPEPLWNPPCVSIAMIGWTGASVGMPRVIVETSFWAGLVIMATTLPVQIYRVLRDPMAVAPYAGVNMLQAPASFMALAWYSIGGIDWCPWLATLLVTLSQVMFLITCFAIFQRRKAIFQSTRPWLCPDWAAFTFPLISTSHAALYFLRDDKQLGSRDSAGAVVWGCWVLLLFLLASVVTLVVASWHLVRCMTWIKNEKNELDASSDIPYTPLGQEHEGGEQTRRGGGFAHAESMAKLRQVADSIFPQPRGQSSRAPLGRLGAIQETDAIPIATEALLGRRHRKHSNATITPLRQGAYSPPPCPPMSTAGTKTIAEAPVQQLKPLMTIAEAPVPQLKPLIK